MLQQPIGVFDSGIGGLTVVRHLLRTLPHEHFVYLGDTARVPYGNRSADTVRVYAEQCMQFLLSHRVQAIVVACNTVSAVAMEHLVARCPVPVIGVIEPAASEASAASSSGSIGVIGTRATIASQAYTAAIHRHRPQARIVSKACPLFVPLVEEGWLDTPATHYIVESYLSDIRTEGVDTLVLGCTHYPLLAPLIQQTLPNTRLIDCGACTATETAKHIRKQGAGLPAEDTKHRLQVFVTDPTPMFEDLATTFLGMTLDPPSVVSIDHHGPP